MACVNGLIGHQSSNCIQQGPCLLTVLDSSVLHGCQVYLAHVLQGFCIAHLIHDGGCLLLSDGLVQVVYGHIKLRLSGVGVQIPSTKFCRTHWEYHGCHGQEGLHVCLCVKDRSSPLIHSLFVFLLGLVVCSVRTHNTACHVHISPWHSVHNVVVDLLSILTEHTVYLCPVSELTYEALLGCVIRTKYDIHSVTHPHSVLRSLANEVTYGLEVLSHHLALVFHPVRIDALAHCLHGVTFHVGYLVKDQVPPLIIPTLSSTCHVLKYASYGPW